MFSEESLEIKNGRSSQVPTFPFYKNPAEGLLYLCVTRELEYVERISVFSFHGHFSALDLVSILK